MIAKLLGTFFWCITEGGDLCGEELNRIVEYVTTILYTLFLKVDFSIFPFEYLLVFGESAFSRLSGRLFRGIDTTRQN